MLSTVHILLQMIEDYHIITEFLMFGLCFLSDVEIFLVNAQSVCACKLKFVPQMLGCRWLSCIPKAWPLVRLVQWYWICWH